MRVAPRVGVVSLIVSWPSGSKLKPSSAMNAAPSENCRRSMLRTTSMPSEPATPSTTWLTRQTSFSRKVIS
ncbi:hypothetical protein D9M68_853080 [compost metagenome]